MSLSLIKMLRWSAIISGDIVRARAAHEYQVYPRTRVRYPWENPRNPYSRVSGTWFLKTRRVQVSILENSGTCDRYLCFLASKYGHDISHKIVFFSLNYIFYSIVVYLCLVQPFVTFIHCFIQVYGTSTSHKIRLISPSNSGGMLRLISLLLSSAAHPGNLPS